MISRTVAAGWSLLKVETVKGFIPNMVNETTKPASAALDCPTRIVLARITVLIYRSDATDVSAAAIEKPLEKTVPPIAKGLNQWIIPSWTFPSDCRKSP